jgi:hypothetical protein
MSEVKVFFNILLRLYPGIVDVMTFEINSYKNLYGIRYDYLLISCYPEDYEIVKRISNFFMVDWKYQNTYNNKLYLELIIDDTLNIDFINEIRNKKSMDEGRVHDSRNNRQLRLW